MESPPAPCESVESMSEREISDDYRIIRKERGMRKKNNDRGELRDY